LDAAVSAKEDKLAKPLSELSVADKAKSPVLARSSKLSEEGIKTREMLFMHLERVYRPLMETLRGELLVLDIDNAMLSEKCKLLEATAGVSPEATAATLGKKNKMSAEFAGRPESSWRRQTKVSKRPCQETRTFGIRNYDNQFLTIYQGQQ